MSDTPAAPPASPAPSPPVQRVLAPPPAPKKKSRAGLFITLVIVGGLFAMCAPLCFIGAPKAVSAKTILEIDLEQPLDEGAGAAGALSLFPSEGNTLLDVIRALEKAKGDEHVVGLVARVGGGGQSLATVQELREAIASFRAAGKPAIAFAETFGEMSPGVGGYVLATSFDEIWLQPSGDLWLTGLFGEGMFLRGALEKLAVEPQIYGRKEYKNAVDQFTQTTFTGPHKEAMERILTSYEEQLVDDIAQSRPALGDKAAVRALLVGGPLSAQQALEKKLVDKLGYKDEMLAALGQRFGKEAKRLWVSRYAERAGIAWSEDGAGAVGGDAPVVALVVAKGTVTRGKNGVDPLGGGESFGSDTTSAAIRAAADDDDVKVILLRVDSPGGSYIGADTIWRAIGQAQAKGKKVVASMGDLAASGGYFVSMNADRVVAARATLTGSIGVFAGKFVTAQAWEKAGVNFDVIATEGVDASLYSSDLPYSEAAKAEMDAMLDRVYLDFTTKAAAGRKMKYDDLEALAHGRVWTGADAKERGLVDDLGGFLRAVAIAKELAGAGAAADGDIRLRSFPSPKPPFEELLAAIRGEPGENSDDLASQGVELRTPAAIAHARRALVDVSTLLDAQVLSAPLPRALLGAP